jgi:hypothetical protein
MTTGPRIELEHVILPPKEFAAELCKAGTYRLDRFKAMRMGVVYHCPGFTLEAELSVLTQPSLEGLSNMVREFEAGEAHRRRVMRVSGLMLVGCFAATIVAIVAGLLL